MSDWLDAIKWDADGLIPAIAQDHKTQRVLMMAWMNRESLQLTVDEGRAIYWSRSRGKLWRKGEESGAGRGGPAAGLIAWSRAPPGAPPCPPGRQSCFYRVYDNASWKIVEPV